MAERKKKYPSHAFAGIQSLECKIGKYLYNINNLFCSINQDAKGTIEIIHIDINML